MEKRKTKEAARVIQRKFVALKSKLGSGRLLKRDITLQKLEREHFLPSLQFGNTNFQCFHVDKGNIVV